MEGIYIEKGWWDKGELIRSQDRSLQHIWKRKYVAEESFLRTKELEKRLRNMIFE